MGISIHKGISVGVQQGSLPSQRLTEEDTTMYLTEEDSSKIIIQEDEN